MGELESMANGRAIRRPEGWIASHRAKVVHLLEGKMTEAEYIAFDILIHAVGWDKKKPNYGKIERNISRIHREWFYRWTRQHVNKVVNSLASKLYIVFEGEWILIPNFAKYQAVTDRKGATVVAGDSQDGATGIAQGATTVAVSATSVAHEGIETRTTSESCEPKQTINKLKPVSINTSSGESSEGDAQSLSLPTSLEEKRRVKKFAEAEVFLWIEDEQGKPFAVTKDKIAQYKQTYTDIDVEDEVRRAKQWHIDNPAKRKTSAGMLRFLNNWLSTASERKRKGEVNGRAKPPVQPYKPPNGYERDIGNLTAENW